MDELLELLFGSEATPIRRDVTIRLREGPNGGLEVETLGGETHVLSPEGSVDRIQVSREEFHHCGHTTEIPLGGRCREPGCSNTSCINCFDAARCAICNVPQCLEHAARVEIQDGVVVSACGQCREDLGRREFWQKVKRALLTPIRTT